MGSGFLLLEHGVEDWDDPLFKFLVVAVGDDEVADAVHAVGAEGGTVGGEAAGGDVGGGEAFDEVFFDAAGGCYDCGDVVVLGEVTEGGAEAGGDEVGGVA